MLQGKGSANRKEIIIVKWRVPYLFKKLSRLCQQYVNGLQVQTHFFACQRFIKKENVMKVGMNLLMNFIYLQDWQQLCCLSYVSVFPALEHLSVLLSTLDSATVGMTPGSWLQAVLCFSPDDGCSPGPCRDLWRSCM